MALSSSERERSVEPWIRARLPISASRLTSALAPAETPITVTRPPVASALRLSGMLGAPTSSRITSNGPCSAKPSGAITLAPSSATASRWRSLPTVAVPRAPAARPSWIAAVPTPPAPPCTSRRSPLRSCACVKRESCAVAKTSGTPPAALQSSASSTGISWRSCTRHSSACAPPPTIAITRAPTSKRSTPRPSAATSPANSIPGMSCGEPGGAGYSPRRCIMSAPFRPAACTRTSTSPSPGCGSGCCSTTMSLSRMVTARTARSLSALARRVRQQPEHVARYAPGGHRGDRVLRRIARQRAVHERLHARPRLHDRWISPRPWGVEQYAQRPCDLLHFCDELRPGGGRLPGVIDHRAQQAQHPAREQVQARHARLLVFDRRAHRHAPRSDPHGGPGRCARLREGGQRPVDYVAGGQCGVRIGVGLQPLGGGRRALLEDAQERAQQAVLGVPQDL